MKPSRVQPLARYLSAIARARKRGDATEHTYRVFNHWFRETIRLMQEIDKAIPKWPIE